MYLKRCNFEIEIYVIFLKALLLRYKTVVIFILTFSIVYGVLTITHKFYLQFSTGTEYFPDYFTNLVAQQTEILLNNFGYKTVMIPHSNEPSIKIIVNDKYLARIIEGCNSLSVIILFASFIIAFSRKLKVAILYAFSGAVIIYVVNLFRIVVLSIGLYHYPEKEHILHTVVFPAIIYGIVFLLWLIWVNGFSKKKKKNE